MTQTISNYDLTAYNYQMFAPAGVDEKKVEALAEDMKKNGFTSVILLANLDGWYLVTGTHRYLAAKKLKKRTSKSKSNMLTLQTPSKIIAKEKT